MEVGTLKELNVQPGDIVRDTYDDMEFTVDSVDKTFCYGTSKLRNGKTVEKDSWSMEGINTWEVVSRAKDVQSENPKTWGELSDEEKGALLLAAHEGKSIEVWDDIDLEWLTCRYPNWTHGCAYRLPKEPKRETVTLYGFTNDNGSYYDTVNDHGDTHRFTFDTIDGIPDPTTIRMEYI